MQATAQLAGTADPTKSSRARILETAKCLFAAKGYEHATTSAIARIAGTSETQMVKYFGSKQGLLEAIFTVGWQEILAAAREGMQNCRSSDEKLGMLLRAVEEVMSRDPELKLLMLLEGRRIRKDGPFLMLTKTFLDFVQLFDGILTDMQNDGSIRADLNLEAVRSAMMGMLEGLLRDKFLAQKTEYPANYSNGEITKVFSVVLRSFAPTK